MYELTHVVSERCACVLVAGACVRADPPDGRGHYGQRLLRPRRQRRCRKYAWHY